MNLLVKKTGLNFLLVIGMLIHVGCGSEEPDENPLPTTSAHSYDISITGGEILAGEVPKENSGIYNAVSFVQYNDEAGQNTVNVMVQETGKAQVVFGILLDDNNKPTSVVKSGKEFTSVMNFGKWAEELRYASVECTFTLEDYQEHDITVFGDEATVASFTLNFDGVFEASTTGEEVEASGKITIAAP
ncbi:hypothetical protein LZF95_08465 [Algoriphagus sp. AGSA1]|uniref:hypothetical protein n=1 Tax=Algoriphagus sp. AGSA1 TaxID=2907213 RepID=UPI001F2010A6|nr:hypothetical protein [Algoriphagus sp. AGSA1]MCE7054703.1 hypothetical protein [Algoriphagus sp. AGSA1]